MVLHLRLLAVICLNCGGSGRINRYLRDLSSVLLLIDGLWFAANLEAVGHIRRTVLLLVALVCGDLELTGCDTVKSLINLHLVAVLVCSHTAVDVRGIQRIPLHELVCLHAVAKEVCDRLLRFDGFLRSGRRHVVVVDNLGAGVLQLA